MILNANKPQIRIFKLVKLKKLLDSIGRTATDKTGFLSVEDMQKVLMRERARADRNHHEFSLILIEIDEHEKNRVTLRRASQVFHTRIRRIDEIGWLNQGHLAIILPYTEAGKAAHLAIDIQKRLSDIVSSEQMHIYAYPSIWPYKK